MLCVLMLLGTIGVTGSVSGEENELDIDDYLFLETGTRDSDDPFDRGDFVAINMTKDGALSWFGVIYGTDEDPNSILIFCAYVRFLGAAEVYDDSGEFIGRYPIPIITVFGQRLFVLFEYVDDGRFYTPIPNVYEDYPESADNGLFDFVKADENEGLWAIGKEHETVNRAVNLTQAWTRSQVIETSDPEDTTTKSWDFSLTAKDIDYGIEIEDGTTILTDPHNKLEELNFTFHITANVDEAEITGVPWYRIEVDSKDNGRILDSDLRKTKDYKATSVTADFKFDHLIDGWDFTDGDGIVLINHGFFANVIPKKVEEWLGEQFMYDIAGGGTAEYEAIDPTQSDAVKAIVTNATEDEDKNGDGIADAKLLTKDEITFKDNWQKVGEITWISDVDVDGEDRNMTYQIHGGQKFNETTKEGDASIIGFIIQGGYIYPAGNRIYHDPSLIATALLMDMDPAFNLLRGSIVCGQFLLALMAVVIVVALVLVQKRREKNPRGEGQYPQQGPYPQQGSYPQQGPYPQQDPNQPIQPPKGL